MSRPVLYFSPTSPYVRKVLIAAKELGIDGTIDLVAPAAVLPTSTSNEVSDRGANPLGKIPALLPTPDSPASDAIIGSSIISQYLDHVASTTTNTTRRILPTDPLARIRVLTTEALADGATDALLLARYETALRPADKQWAQWEEGQLSKTFRALAALDARIAKDGGAVTAGVNVADPGSTLDLASIAVGTLVGYLEFRFAHIAWKEKYPALAAWYAKLATRPSFASTAPPQ
ncbi:glutathione S-transferase-like protein YibF [Zopfochytrium polystomum]|nr:glutathione S-transferase-like protein YibF [Zopfochytrium polystomum]